MSHKMYFYFLWFGNIGLAARGRITMPGYFTAVVNICNASRDFHESGTWKCEIKCDVTIWGLFCWFCRPLWFDHMQCSKKRQIGMKWRAIAILDISVWPANWRQLVLKSVWCLPKSLTSFSALIFLRSSSFAPCFYELHSDKMNFDFLII